MAPSSVERREPAVRLRSTDESSGWGAGGQSWAAGSWSGWCGGSVGAELVAGRGRHLASWAGLEEAGGIGLPAAICSGCRAGRSYGGSGLTPSRSDHTLRRPCSSFKIAISGPAAGQHHDVGTQTGPQRPRWSRSGDLVRTHRHASRSPATNGSSGRTIQGAAHFPHDIPRPLGEIQPGEPEHPPTAVGQGILLEPVGVEPIRGVMPRPAVDLDDHSLAQEDEVARPGERANVAPLGSPASRRCPTASSA